MCKQTHRTCVRISAEEYSWLTERSKAAGLSANAWLMEQLADNRPIISRDGVMPDFLCLLNQKGREINTVARAFNSGYGTAEELRQALDCLKNIAQAAYEIRKEGFTHHHITVERLQTACGREIRVISVFPRHGSETAEDKLKALAELDFQHRKLCA